jgi:hypothetical protein
VADINQMIGDVGAYGEHLKQFTCMDVAGRVSAPNTATKISAR